MRRMMLALLVLAGCGEAPDRSRLDPGDTVVLVPDPRGRVRNVVAAELLPGPLDDAEVRAELRRRPYRDVVAGTPAVVVRDDPGPAVPTRKVTVNLRGGDYVGRLATVPRHCLHPDD